MGEEDTTRLFIRIIGMMFVFYGFFAFVDPENYAFGGFDSATSQFTGLVMMSIGLLLLLKRGKLFGK